MPNVIASSISLPKYDILSATFTTQPSQVYGAYWFGSLYSSKSIHSSLGFRPFSSTSPQCDIMPSLTAYVKLRFCIFLLVSSSNSILSTYSNPFLSCQNDSPISLLDISDNILSPACPNGLCPISWPVAIAFVSSVFNPKYLAIV